MRMHTRSCVMFIVGVAIAAPTPAAAQVRFELGPFVAAYAPLGSFRAGDYVSTALPIKPSDLSGLAWGGQGRLWVTPRVGIQVQAAVANSRFGGGVPTPGGFITTPKDATVVTLTAQVAYRPLRSSPAVVLSAGVGMVRHGGEAYDWPAFQGLNPLAVAVGLASDFHITHWLTATLGVTTLLYDLDVHDSFNQHFERGLQADLLPHVTLALGSPRP
jgi:hypothetical protein